MDVALATLAALAATGFAIDLGVNARRRPRPHMTTWTVALGGFAIATWTLVVGLGFGWSAPLFRAFYWLGAIANIPLLAAGSVYLVAGVPTGRRFTLAVVAFLAAGAVAVLAADIRAPLAGVGVPEGSEVFAFSVTLGGVEYPGPRLFAAIAGSVGTIVVVGLAMVSIVREPRNRRRVLGNTLIVLGTLAPAAGGSLTALGENGGFAVSLLAGAVLLWGGFRVASAAGRRTPAAP